MENTTVALTLSLIAGLSTIIGSIFIFFKKDKSILLNSFAFAAGVMITVSLIDLIPDKSITQYLAFFIHCKNVFSTYF